MVPLELVSVQVFVAGTHAMILRELGGERRVLPIMIGEPEAQSISGVLEGHVPPRPLTHDLTVTLLAVLGASLERVVLTEVVDTTYYAELHLRTATGEAVVSSRPSDGVALAIRIGAPVVATESLLDEVGRPATFLDDEDDDEDDDPESILEEFRDFLDDLDPDDFAS